jgi:hypothetical protein
MIDIFSTLQLVLREAGFSTRLVSIEHSSIVCFEDDTLLGFGCIFENPANLLDRWKETEMSLLKRFAPSVRAAGEKAWNVYCLFLCGAPADPIRNRQVRWVEENLERTRKVAACGLKTREDILRALLLVLPLQNQPELRPENITERLQTRIRTIAPSTQKVVLDQSVSPTEVVRLLGEP